MKYDGGSRPRKKGMVFSRWPALEIVLPEAGCVAWSPDGKVLASGTDYQIALWDVSTGKLLSTLEVPWGYVLSVAWSPDGKVLASGSQFGGSCGMRQRVKCCRPLSPATI